MRIDARLLVLGLVAGSPTLWGCAPPCYDDGVLQSGCPEEAETEAASASGSASDTATTGTASADGSGDSGVMTAEGSGDDTVDGSTTNGVQCPSFQELIAPDTRTFEFVLDQSGSMTFDLDGVSRYNAVAEALFDPAMGVVTEQQADTRFGMVLYRGLQASCPVIESLPPQADAAIPLSGLMAANPPSGAAPVPEAVEEAVTELTADAAAGDKTLVLVMGTEPGSCDIQTPVNAIELATTRADAIDAITAAYAAGFGTRVIAVGTDIDESFLQLAANAGIGHMAGDPDATYWIAQDRPELVTAATEATASDPRGCSFALGEDVSAELAPACEVVVNGGSVMYQDPDGWDLPDPQTLELSGAACESIQQGLATITMMCTCDA